MTQHKFVITKNGDDDDDNNNNNNNFIRHTIHRSLYDTIPQRTDPKKPFC
jgi:hypothetical protein